MLQHFATNLAIYTFITYPELFSITDIFAMDDRLEHMLTCRCGQSVVWN